MTCAILARKIFTSYNIDFIFRGYYKYNLFLIILIASNLGYKQKQKNKLFVFPVSSPPCSPTTNNSATMATEQSVMAVIRAARPQFRTGADKAAFAVHAAFAAAGYVLHATGPAAFADDALSISSKGNLLDSCF